MSRAYALLIFIVLSGLVPLHAQKNKSWLEHLSSIRTLDSLIHAAPTLALNSSDYPHGNLDSLLSRAWIPLMKADTLQIDHQIKGLALHFFEDLSYGNKAPNLDFVGVKNPLQKQKLETSLEAAWLGNNLGSFAMKVRNRMVEISTLLEALAQGSVDGPWKKSDIIDAIQEYRWLYSLKTNQDLVLVNIPRAELEVFQKARPIMAMKVVLGKTENPTRTLLSRFHTLVINPFWYVPKRIAARELLPKILKNTHYFEDNQFQVLNAKNEVIDPASVDWKSLGPKNFPYTLRQSTGCDNSLGLMKLQFQSPFTIFLHDSPEKKLFQAKQRYFSHGCVRLEKPMELGRWLLGKNKIAIDTVNFSPTRINPQSVTVPLTGNTLLLIWYPKLEVNAAGEIFRNDDIYHKFPQE